MLLGELLEEILDLPNSARTARVRIKIDDDNDVSICAVHYTNGVVDIEPDDGETETGVSVSRNRSEHLSQETIDAICQAYLDGIAPAEIEAQYAISHAGLYDILDRENVPRNRMLSAGARTIHIGVVIAKPTHLALKEQAAKDGESVSAWMSACAVEKLRELGYPLQPEREEKAS